MSVAIANMSMPIDRREQIYNELSTEYPNIPSHVIYEVMHQYSCNKYQCIEALKKVGASHSDISSNTQPNLQLMYVSDRARGDEATTQGTEVRPRSDSVSSVSSNSSSNDVQIHRPSSTQPSARAHYTAETKYFVDQYQQGYNMHQGFQANDMSQLRNLRIVEEGNEEVPPNVQIAAWTDNSPRAGQFPPVNQQMPGIVSSQWYYENQRSAQGSPHASRPQRFDQGFPDRNGEFRESPNTPSPVAHQIGYQGASHSTPVTMMQENMKRLYPGYVYPEQGSGYTPQPLNHGHGGYSPQQQGNFQRHIPTSQTQNLSHQNYKSSMFIPYVPRDGSSQPYRTPSPSQPHKDLFRNVPQSLPVYRQPFHQQASSDSSPGTPGQSKATTPGQYNHPNVGLASSPGQYSQALASQPSPAAQYSQALPGLPAPGSSGQVMTGLTSAPGHFQQSSQYPHGAPSRYGVPGSYPVQGAYQHPQVASTHFPGAHPYVFPADWHNQPTEPTVAWAFSESDPSQITPQNAPFATSHADLQNAGAGRQQHGQNTSHRSSVGEDSEYIKTLLEHQRKRKIKLEEDLDNSYKFLERLRKENGSMEADLMNRRKTRTHFTATAEDVQKKKQENRKLQVDIHLLTMKIDAVTGNNSQLRLGVLDMPQSGSNFYSNIPVGQQVCPPNPPVVQRREPPPRPPLPSLPVAEREPPNWTCSACTFKNHPFLDKCEICEMPRMTNGPMGYG